MRSSPASMYTLGTASSVGSMRIRRELSASSQFVAVTRTLNGSMYWSSISTSVSRFHSGRFESGYRRMIAVESTWVAASSSTFHAKLRARPPPPVDAAASTTRSPAQ